MTRKLVFIKKTATQSDVTHYWGLPPSLTDDEDQRVMLPKAAVLVIEETGDGYFLFRYTSTGEFAGDTWHEGLEASLCQAEREFCVDRKEWVDIPSNVEDWYYYIFRKHQ